MVKKIPPIPTKWTTTWYLTSYLWNMNFNILSSKVENKYYHGYTKIIDILCVICQNR